jgi:DNA-binding NarL/FixJ family response regulator
LRILIVDPEYLVALEAESLIQQSLVQQIAGGFCLIAMPRDLPAMLSAETFDVVVIDEDIAERAENSAALARLGMPVVVLTFHADEPVRSDGRLMVAKPFEDDILIAAVAEAIRRASPPSETG